MVRAPWPLVVKGGLLCSGHMRKGLLVAARQVVTAVQRVFFFNSSSPAFCWRREGTAKISVELAC